MGKRPLDSSIRLFHELFGAHPSHSALLDLDGKILAVNRSWIRFGLENGLADDYDFDSASYLEVCERAAIAQSPYAAEAIAGILSVLDSIQPSFAMVYPCHSPVESRWFKMWAQTQLPAVPAVVVAHTYLGGESRSVEYEAELDLPAAANPFFDAAPGARRGGYFAPCSFSNSINVMRPNVVASSSGVMPSRVREFTSAP